MEDNDDIYNLKFSYGVHDDLEFDKKGMIFLGAGKDNENKEVHVFLKHDGEKKFSTETTIYFIKLAHRIKEEYEQYKKVFNEK
jgi:hypothetical protein